MISLLADYHAKQLDAVFTNKPQKIECYYRILE